MKKLIFLCSILSQVICLGQDSSSVKKLLDEAYSLEANSPDSALQIYNHALTLSKEINYLKGAFRAVNYSGIVHSDNGRFDSAIYYYKASIPYAEKIDFKSGIASAYINIANSYYFKGSYNKSLEPYLKGIKIYEELNDSVNLNISYSNLAAFSSSYKHNENEIKYLQEALRFTKKNNIINKAYATSDLGFAYLKSSDLISAKQYFDIAKNLNLKHKDIGLSMFVNRNYGEYYSAKKDHAQAILYYKKALEFSKQKKEAFYTNNFLCVLGEQYIKMEKHKLAKPYVIESITLSKDINSQDILQRSYHSLSEVFKNENNPKAYDYLLLSAQLKDSIFKNTYLKEIVNLEQDFDTEKKEKELIEQKLLIQTQENQIIKKRSQYSKSLLVSGILLLTLILVYLFYRSRQKLKNKQIETLKTK